MRIHVWKQIRLISDCGNNNTSCNWKAKIIWGKNHQEYFLYTPFLIWVALTCFRKQNFTLYLCIFITFQLLKSHRQTTEQEFFSEWLLLTQLLYHQYAAPYTIWTKQHFNTFPYSTSHCQRCLLQGNLQSNQTSSFSVNLTQTYTYMGRGNLNKENASTRLARGQVCGALHWWIINLRRLRHLGMGPSLGRWSWII